MPRSDPHAARRHRLILGVLALLPLSAYGQATKPATTAPAATAPVATPPPPATAPAVPPPPPPAPAPAPAPKAVALAFAAALDRGDVAAAAALLPGGVAAHGKWVEANVALIAALKKLDAAAVARFGEAGKSVSQGQLHVTDALKSIEGAQEKVEGEVATLTPPGTAQPLRLTRVDGKWLLEIAPAGTVETRQRALYVRLSQAAARTTDEIAAGAYPTPESAARAFAARVLETRLGG